MDNGHLLLLADVILVVHFCIALFITWSLPLIWLGRMLKWEFVHNPWFRFIHLGLMGVVLAESLIGMLCPLTTWEADLREAAGMAYHDQSFVAHWVSRLLFHDFSETAYTIAYALFFLAVIATLFFVPIRLKSAGNRKKRTDSSP